MMNWKEMGRKLPVFEMFIRNIELTQNISVRRTDADFIRYAAGLNSSLKTKNTGYLLQVLFLVGLEHSIWLLNV
jgi:hypothetical protein